MGRTIQYYVYTEDEDDKYFILNELMMAMDELNDGDVETLYGGRILVTINHKNSEDIEGLLDRLQADWEDVCD